MLDLAVAATSDSRDDLDLLEPVNLVGSWRKQATRGFLVPVPAPFSLSDAFTQRTSTVHVLGSRHLIVTLPEGADASTVAEAILQLLEDVKDGVAAAAAPLPGAPSAVLLVSAAAELGSWLSLTQQQVMYLVGMSPSTVMAWKREPATHPRQKNIPILIRLWAAVSGARQQFGPDETLRMVWRHVDTPGEKTDGVLADQLANDLINETEAASQAELALDDGYDPEAPLLVDVEELEAGELELSAVLTQYLEKGEPGAE